MVGRTHAAEKDGLAPLKGPQRRLRAVVPFARQEGGVTRLRKLLRPRCLSLELVIHTKKCAPAQQHRPRRHTPRAVVGTHAVCPRERRALLREPIERRSADVRIAQRAERIRPLIGAEQEEHVRLAPALRGHGCGDRQHPQREEAGERLHHRILTGSRSAESSHFARRSLLSSSSFSESSSSSSPFGGSLRE